MNITDAAIEAGAKAYFQARGNDDYEHLKRVFPGMVANRRERVHSILEAALPHLQPTIPTGPAGIPVYERLPIGTTLIWTDPQGRTWRGGRDDDGWWAEGYSMGMTAEQMATCGAEWTIVWSPA